MVHGSLPPPENMLLQLAGFRSAVTGCAIMTVSEPTMSLFRGAIVVPVNVSDTTSGTVLQRAKSALIGQGIK
jgi:hypothetical protein